MELYEPPQHINAALPHPYMSLFACCFAFTSTLYAHVTIRTCMHVHADTNMQTHVYAFVNFHLQNIECLVLIIMSGT